MGRMFVGAVIVICGIIILSNSLGLTSISIGDFWGTFFWPLLFIVAGVSFLTNRRRMSTGRWLFGLVLILLGLMFLGDRLTWFDFNIGDVWKFFWPLVLILFGLSVVFGSDRSRRRRERKRHSEWETHSKDQDDLLNEQVEDSAHHSSGSSSRTSQWALFSSVEHGHTGWTLKDADYWAFLGSVVLDLRTAAIPEGETVLSLTAFMGNVQVIVPPDVSVDCEGTTVLGSLHFFGRDHSGFFVTHNGGQGNVQSATKIVRMDCTSCLGSVRVISRPS